MGWSRKCEKRGKHWLRAAALGVVFLWTAGSSLQAEAESSKSAHWHKGVGVEAWLTGADNEQVSQNAASQNDAADTAIAAVGGQGTDVASDSADNILIICCLGKKRGKRQKTRDGLWQRPKQAL